MQLQCSLISQKEAEKVWPQNQMNLSQWMERDQMYHCLYFNMYSTMKTGYLNTQCCIVLCAHCKIHRLARTVKQCGCHMQWISSQWIGLLSPTHWTQLSPSHCGQVDCRFTGFNWGLMPSQKVAWFVAGFLSFFHCAKGALKSVELVANVFTEWLISELHSSFEYLG